MPREELVIHTKRLRLVAGTAAMVQAERDAAADLVEMLGATIPEDWPPELVDEEVMEFWLDRLQTSPDQAGWWCWYIVLEDGVNESPVLIGGAGFKGPPAPDGTVETGYSILPQFQNRGYCTEAVRALIRWAFDCSQTSRIVAQTMPELKPSLRVLEKLEFKRLDEAFEEGAVAFELPRARFAAES